MAAGRGREASLRFSRILLGDPTNPRAREGEVAARALLAEEERVAALKVHEAHLAPDSRQVGEAEGGDRAISSPHRPGALGGLEGGPRPVSEGSPGRSALAPRVGGSTRMLLVLGWGAALAVVLGLVATSWERIVGDLARTPRPVSQPAPPATSLREPTTAEAALAQARLLLAAGDARSALRLLEQIPTQDPNWPFARQVRAEAEAALGLPR